MQTTVDSFEKGLYFNTNSTFEVPDALFREKKKKKEARRIRLPLGVVHGLPPQFQFTYNITQIGLKCKLFQEAGQKSLSEMISFFTITLYIRKIIIHYIYVIKFCQKVRFI